MNLSGTLSDWTVSDLLNVMKVTGKTASLHIKGERTGTVHFVEGKVVGASLDGKAVPAGEFESPTVASDTLFVLAGLADGVFEVVPFEGPEAEGWEVETLLSDMQQLAGLESDLVEAGLRDAFVLLRDEIDEPVTVRVEDWWAIASLVSVLSFDQLEDVFGKGRAIRLLHTLWRTGLIEKVDDTAGEGSAVAELLLAEEPSAVDLSDLDDADLAAPPAVEPSPKPDEDSWLDEIAAAADTSPLEDRPERDVVAAPRTVLGVAAPASTVLTGSVLDEMRRLRVRPTD